MKNAGELILLILLITLISFEGSPASSAPDEAYGRVVKIVDGDTIDVQLLEYTNRTAEDLIRVRLADIDTPEVRGQNACGTGKIASAYTRTWLLNNFVFLDLDGKTGQDRYDRWAAVVYLSEDGKPGLNFNKQLVDTGHACIWDYDDNEFTPADWWNGSIPFKACIGKWPGDMGYE